MQGWRHGTAALALAVGSAACGGGGPEPEMLGCGETESFPSGMVIDGDFLYWNSNAYHRMPKGGGEIENVGAPVGCFYFTVADGWIYSVGLGNDDPPGVVIAFPADGSQEPIRLATQSTDGNRGLHSPVVDDEFLYLAWYDGQSFNRTGEIRRVPRTGGDVEIVTTDTCVTRIRR